MSILTNKIPNLTENAKVLILSKLEEGWSIRGVAQYYNIAKSTVQSIKRQYYGVLKYHRHFMLSNLPNLYKKDDAQISKRHLYMGKKL
jgi:DNA-binding NarL/FixJ family response regulator